MERDVVCGMQVDPAKAPAKSEYNGKTYYFCALSCKKTFGSATIFMRGLAGRFILCCKRRRMTQPICQSMSRSSQPDRNRSRYRQPNPSWLKRRKWSSVQHIRPTIHHQCSRRTSPFRRRSASKCHNHSLRQPHQPHPEPHRPRGLRSGRRARHLERADRFLLRRCHAR